MQKLLCVGALVLVLGVVLGDPSDSTNVKPPQIHVYTRWPLEPGKENELICHCNNFHPPRIELNLKQQGKEMPDCQQTDMTFKEDWAYYVTKSVKFTPQAGVEYTCEVSHNDGPAKSVKLDSFI